MLSIKDVILTAKIFIPPCVSEEEWAVNGIIGFKFDISRNDRLSSFLGSFLLSWYNGIGVSISTNYKIYSSVLISIGLIVDKIKAFPN